MKKTAGNENVGVWVLRKKNGYANNRNRERKKGNIGECTSG